LISVENSIQDPLKGITLAEYNFVIAWKDCPKKTLEIYVAEKQQHVQHH
jgi:hypothetical protein